jgi:hypothetical protein
MRAMLLVGPLAILACQPPSRQSSDERPDGGGSGRDAAPFVDAGPFCDPPPTPAGPDVELAPPFDELYSVYDLGPVPGVPNPLGGTVIAAGDDDTLLVAGASETESGAIYAIGVARDACGHITGFVGAAEVRAFTPYVDANLVYHGPALLLYTEWPSTSANSPRAATRPGAAPICAGSACRAATTRGRAAWGSCRPGWPPPESCGS